MGILTAPFLLATVPTGFLQPGQRSESLPLGNPGPYPTSLTHIPKISSQARSQG